MIVMMVVMDWCSVIVLLCVGKGLFRVMSEVRHMLFVLIVAVMSLLSHWVVVATVETSMVHWAIIEVLRIVMSIVMAVLDLVVSVMMICIMMLSNMLWLVMMSIDRQVMVHIGVMVLMIVSVHVLNIVIIIMNLLVMDHRLEMLNDMMHNLVDNWLVDNFVMHDSLVMRNSDDLVDSSFGHFRVCLGLYVMITSGTFGLIEVLSLVLINIVTWGVMHRIIRCLVMQNFVRNNLMVTNLFVTGQNIVMNKTRFMDSSLMVKLILMNMSSHVFFVEFLRHLNVS